MNRKIVAVAFLFLITIASAPIPASALGIGASSATLDFGSRHDGDTANATVRVYNTDNRTALNYTAALTNLTGGSIAPASGRIAPKQNASIEVMLHVPQDAQAGTYNGLLLVNTTARAANNTTATALAVQVTYNVTAQPSPIVSTDFLVDGLLIADFAIIAAFVLYLIRKY